MRKHNLSVSSLLVMASLTTLVIGCSRGGNVPKGWDESSVLHLKCMSAKTFTTTKVNEFRQSKMNSLRSSQGVSLLTIRTVLKEITNFDENSNDEFVQNLLSELPTDQTFEEMANSKQMILAEKKDCTNLKAEYRGPGVSGVLEGKLLNISVNSIELEGVDAATQILINVKVEKTMPRKKTDPAGYQKAMQKEDNGFSELVVTISRSVQGKKLAGAVITQRSVLSSDEELVIGDSVFQLMAERAGRGISPQSEAKLQAMKTNKLQIRSAKKSDTVKVNFSELMDLKRASEVVVLTAATREEVAAAMPAPTTEVVAPTVNTADASAQTVNALLGSEAELAAAVKGIKQMAQEEGRSTSGATDNAAVVNWLLGSDAELKAALKNFVQEAQQDEAAQDADAQAAQREMDALSASENDSSDQREQEEAEQGEETEENANPILST